MIRSRMLVGIVGGGLLCGEKKMRRARRTVDFYVSSVRP